MDGCTEIHYKKAKTIVELAEKVEKKEWELLERIRFDISEINRQLHSLPMSPNRYNDLKTKKETLVEIIETIKDNFDFIYKEMSK